MTRTKFQTNLKSKNPMTEIRRGRKKRPTTGDFKRFLAERAAQGLPPLSADPQEQIAEFQRYFFAKCQRQADAILEANFSTPAATPAPVHAPLAALPAFPAPIDVLSMT
jgi:hypothetical protein